MGGFSQDGLCLSLLFPGSKGIWGLCCHVKTPQIFGHQFRSPAVSEGVLGGTCGVRLCPFIFIINP